MQKLKQLMSGFSFWLILNSAVSLALILVVCLSTAKIVESIDSEDRALVSAYSDDLQDIHNLSIEVHRYNTETLAYVLIGDKTLLPRMEKRVEAFAGMLEHINVSHPHDREGRALLNELETVFHERDAFVHELVSERERGTDIHEMARRMYVEGRPITYRLQALLDQYTKRRFSTLEASRAHIDRENSREREQLKLIQYLSVLVGLLLTVTLGKVLTAMYRKSKREAEVRQRALAIAAHDLKNPISNILGSLELMQATNSMQDKQMTEIIERAANNMKQLVQDYLEIGRLEAGKLLPAIEYMRVGELVAHVMQAMKPSADQKGVKLVSDMRVQPGEMIGCDPRLLSQVFSNLIGNALKFSPIGATVTLRVERSSSGLQFSVIDFGPGIPEKHREQVFQQYWQGKKKGQDRGSGLGLSIAKGIVEAHSGQIWVEGNEDGQGSKFSFSIPVTSAQESRALDN